MDAFVKSFQHLRNNLAHSQDLSGDWEVILQLADHLHRIVLGPAAIGASTDSGLDAPRVAD